MTNKPMALAKQARQFGLKPINIADLYPLTEVNGNEKPIQVIFKKALRY